ncbi:hypothetical protein DB30_05987 [Enhygromyxa salina]|uniref:Helix-turn-helix domain protein n=1 Tax=Enhygromyxa salina TaxID=215803 RepID=A0A0C2A6R4_9BACT|nr:hypothetical protein [Enhygromyxa salina]KIG19083.1 hypothetical protein DB30_05987 [Enhygromyxa salina]
MAHAPPKTINTHELATRLGVHEKTIRRQSIGGQIPAHCYSKGGAYSSYRFFVTAVEYLCDHGDWPDQAAMARFGRSRRTEVVDSWDRAGLLAGLHLGGLGAALSGIEDTKVLYQALALEAERRNRKGAMALMRARLAELEVGEADAA